MNYNATSKSVKLDVVLFIEDGTWLAATVSPDVIAQGRTSEDALHNLRQTVEAYYRLDLAAHMWGIKYAPKDICDKYAKGRHYVSTTDIIRRPGGRRVADILYRVRIAQ
jgi:hypothetical protein